MPNITTNHAITYTNCSCCVMQIGSTQDLFNFAFPCDYKIPFDFLLFEARGQQQGDEVYLSYTI